MELHPVAIVFFALGMGSLFGIVGAILAVPAAAGCKILVDEFYLKPQREQGELDEGAVQEKSENLLRSPLKEQPEVQEEQQQAERQENETNKFANSNDADGAASS
jgi:hypothetical protein